MMFFLCGVYKVGNYGGSSTSTSTSTRMEEFLHMKKGRGSCIVITISMMRRRVKRVDVGRMLAAPPMRLGVLDGGGGAVLATG